MDKPEDYNPSHETRFKRGNEVWRIAFERGTIGKNKIFETPHDLLTAAMEYFEWADSNPMLEQKIFHSNGVITKDNIEHPRPYTLAGLYVFSGFTDATWYKYCADPEYSSVCAFINKTMYDQKFSGASTGFFNANLIARDLGIREVSDVKQEVSGTTTVNSNVTIKGDDITDYLKSKHSKE